MPPTDYESAALDEDMEPAVAAQAARPAGHRTKVLASLGLGLAAAAAYALTREGGGPAPALEQSSLDGIQGKFPKAIAANPSKKAPQQKPLIVEGSLADFIDKDVPQDAHPGRLGASLGDAASKLFEHVVQKSAVDKEMTAGELSAYKYRFIAEMMSLQDSNVDASERYLEAARGHIDGAKPVLTEALAEAINKREKTYQVKLQPWMLDESVNSFNDRLIKVPYTVAPESRLKQFERHAPENPLASLKDEKLPDGFKSAEAWPKCAATIEDPHNQGRCGSCWVFGALGALDSRMCIKTGARFSGPDASLSRGYGASCTVDWDGCQGGWPHLIYDYIEKNAGIPATGCDPYFAGSDYADHWSSSMPAPKCPSSCDERFPISMADDMYKPIGVGNYKLVDSPDRQGMEQLKAAIYHGGPVPYAFNANSQFMGYSEGVFDSGCGSQANHAVQAIGWGKMKVGWFFHKEEKEYIQSLNSWGTDWGIKGKFNVAYCVVSHYAIPGDFSGDEPFPALAGDASKGKGLFSFAKKK